MKDENVQAEQTSTEETTSTTAETTEKVEGETAKEQPFSEEQEARMQQLMAEATSKAKDEGKREMQGIKDREVAGANRRAKQAEALSSAYQSGFGDLDEETRKEVETVKMRGENQFYKTQQQEDEARRQQESYYASLNQSLRDEVSNMGIDPTDSRIDYAPDAPNYFEGRKRFSDSLAKAVKVKNDDLEKTLIQKAEDKFKELDTAFRKEHNLDSQDTATSGGVVNQSDADFMAKFGDGSLPLTKENRARYADIKSKHY